jgi:hypothetical protein
MKFGTAALTLLAAAGTTLMATPPSHADAVSPATAVRPVGNAPSCVVVWESVGTISKTGYARNDCGHNMNLKIIWAHGVDGPCRTVGPGHTLGHKVPRGARTFDGANTC